MAWRSRKFFDDKKKWLRLILVSIFGAFVEKLMSELQYRDRVGKGLFDVIFADRANPFLECRGLICATIKAGAAGAIGLLFDYLPVEEHLDILNDGRSIGFACK